MWRTSVTCRVKLGSCPRSAEPSIETYTGTPEGTYLKPKPGYHEGQSVRRNSILLVSLLAARAAVMPTFAQTLEIHNPVGGIYIKIDSGPRLHIEGLGTNRKVTQDDTSITRLPGRIVFRCEPADDEPIRLDAVVPVGYGLDVITDKGAIDVTGLVRKVWLRTQSGDINLAVPLRATHIQFDSEQRPKRIELPKRVGFINKSVQVTETRKIWRLRDRLKSDHITYGEVRVRAEEPRLIRIVDYPIPADSPIKMPWQAPDALRRILQPPSPASKPKQSSEPESVVAPQGGTVFRSDVRMVNLVVTAIDTEGHPAVGLSAEDFEVLEKGRPQNLSFAGWDEAPFNLAILLDLSGSTKPDRDAMSAAVKRLVALAGPHDRVGVYAVAGDVFHVIAPMITDREKLVATIEKLPNVTGGSPLYDGIVLAYSEDLHERPGERNALIVISDGIDNQISKQEAPSAVKFRLLARAAREMNVLIYPVFLRSGERFGRKWSKKARERMWALADATHGRLFPAQSIQDLEPVFPLIESELRGVYSVAYYPEDQAFDGRWRNVKINVKRAGIIVRARAGYYAR